MTEQVSPVKAAVGDKPVFAYIASLPQPQLLASPRWSMTWRQRPCPNLQRSVSGSMS